MARRRRRSRKPGSGPTVEVAGSCTKEEWLIGSGSRRTAGWVSALVLVGAACGYSNPSAPTGAGLRLTVSVTTTGANPDPDGYSLTLDGGAPQSLGVNGSVQFQHLSATQHSLTLGGVAGNCNVTSANPLQVDLGVAYPTQSVAFQVACP